MSNNDLPCNKCKGQHHPADECQADPYRKLAEEIAIEYSKGFGKCAYDRGTDIIEQTLRTTSSQAYREGWNEAVEECASVAIGEMGDEDGYYISKAIRKLLDKPNR